MLSRSASFAIILFLLASCDASSGDVPQGSLADGNATTGKTLYLQHCSGCHGETGRGDGPGAANINPKPKDLTDQQYISSLSDRHLFTVIRKGGSPVGRNAMPPFPNLTDQEIKDLIAYMRSISK